MSIPDGWSYEGPDPSVGIFGHAWTHEDCPGNIDAGEVSEETVREWRVNDNLHELIVLTCACCAAATAVEDVNYIGPPE